MPQKVWKLGYKMEETLELFSTDTLLSLSLNVLVAVVVLILTIILSKVAKSWIKRLGLSYANLDDTLFIFLSNIASIVIQVFGFIFILQRFGFETTSIVALLGAAGLAIGLALQGTLSNFAAGIMLIIRRPFKQGDFIEVAGKMGTVKEISVFTTELASLDNLQLIVPNGQIWGSCITNYSIYDKRRLDLKFNVAYESDITFVEKLISDILNSDPRIHSVPDKLVRVDSIDSNSMSILVRAWCNAGDYFMLKLDLIKTVKTELDTNGINRAIPTSKIISKN
jgi:small conductance mechanosensitive channel